MRELNTDLVEISQTKHKQFIQDQKAVEYSDKIVKLDRIKRNLFSIFIGIILGLIFGMCHVISVSAECTSFSKQEWIDICYIARMVEAESGNQCELGKRLVADTVLNRLNNGSFGSDVKSIVDAKNQYCEGINASTETIRIVMEEYRNQTDTEVLYFRTDKYHEWAIDMFVVGDHYFSK